MGGHDLVPEFKLGAAYDELLNGRSCRSSALAAEGSMTPRNVSA
jgi:hypothetical protein